jgi:hypothetical protein
MWRAYGLSAIAVASVIGSGYCPTGQHRAARQQARQGRHGALHGVGASRRNHGAVPVVLREAPKPSTPWNSVTLLRVGLTYLPPITPTMTRYHRRQVIHKGHWYYAARLARQAVYSWAPRRARLVHFHDPEEMPPDETSEASLVSRYSSRCTVAFAQQLSQRDWKAPRQRATSARPGPLTVEPQLTEWRG